MAQETLWNEAGLLNYKAGDTVPGHLMKENCYHPSADWGVEAGELGNRPKYVSRRLVTGLGWGS